MLVLPIRPAQNTNPRNAARRMHFFITLIFFGTLNRSTLDIQLVGILQQLFWVLFFTRRFLQRGVVKRRVVIFLHARRMTFPLTLDFGAQFQNILETIYVERCILLESST